MSEFKDKHRCLKKRDSDNYTLWNGKEYLVFIESSKCKKLKNINEYEFIDIHNICILPKGSVTIRFCDESYKIISDNKEIDDFKRYVNLNL